MEGTINAQTICEAMEAARPDFDKEEKEWLEKWRLDPTIEDQPIEFCFEYCGIPFMPKGDIQGVKAAQKSGKTFLLTLLMAAARKGEYMGIKCRLPNPRIVYIDSEQHPRNTRLVYRRVCFLSGVNGRERHNEIEFFHMRGAEPETIQQAVEKIARQYTPDIICIDGLVDCVIDSNDMKESKAFLADISRVAMERNCAIIGVLHLNHSGENRMRGHLGTILAEKASDVLSCVKNKQSGTAVFEVEQTENRNDQDISKFAFAIEVRQDTDGQLLAVPVPSYMSANERISLDTLFAWALADSPLRRADLKDKLMSEDCPQRCSRTVAYSRINEAQAAGIIRDDPVTYKLRYIGLNNVPNEDDMPF